MKEAIVHIVQRCLTIDMIGLGTELECGDDAYKEPILLVETTITGNGNVVLAVVTTPNGERRFHIEVKELTQ